MEFAHNCYVVKLCLQFPWRQASYTGVRRTYSKLFSPWLAARKRAGHQIDDRDPLDLFIRCTFLWQQLVGFARGRRDKVGSCAYARALFHSEYPNSKPALCITPRESSLAKGLNTAIFPSLSTSILYDKLFAISTALSRTRRRSLGCSIANVTEKKVK